ncbi:MAG: hypothetical protein PHU77_06750 [Simplicispira sp.]|nr:hypothetical protein [Simplicispira sp.]
MSPSPLRPGAVSAPATAPVPGAQRTAWLLFAPPAALMALRWLLEWQNDRGPQTPVLPLTPFAPPQDALGALWPLLGAVLALLVGVLVTRWAARRWGGRAVQRAGLLAWVALCVAAGAALLWRHLNVHGVQPLAPVPAQVLGSRFTPPSARSVGGTLLVLRVDGIDQTQQVLIPDPQAAQWRPGQRVLLQWARGRSSGLFVTGWQALPAPPPAPPFPAPVAPSGAQP